MSDTDPISIFLVSSGSRGDRLLFRYPYESEEEIQTSNKLHIKNRFAVRINEDQKRQTWHPSALSSSDIVRYNDDVLGNLLAVKSDLCDQNFELKVNDVVFVGFPVSLQLQGSFPPIEPSPKRESSSCVSFHVLFALKGSVDHLIIKCYHSLAKQLAIALKNEEHRCGYLSKQKHLMWVIQDEIATYPEDSRESPYAIMLQKNTLAKKLKAVYDGLCNSGVVQLHINKWVEVSFCLPHKVHNLALPADVYCKIKPEDIQKCISALRPYHGMLLLVSESSLIRSLPIDSSPALTRLVSVTSPLKSLYQLSSDADLALGQVYKLVIHLVYWGKASVIYPLCETNVYILAPNANTCVNSSLVEKFAGDFSASLPAIMSEFSLPTPLGEHRDVLGLPKHQAKQVQMVTWLLRHRLLIQLHTYVFLITTSHAGSHSSSSLETDRNQATLTLPPRSHSNSNSSARNRFSTSTGGSVSESNLANCLGETSVISEESETLEMTSQSSGMNDDLPSQLSLQRSLLSFLSDDDISQVLSIPAADNMEDLKLFVRLCPYFNGKRHLEEIMYYENLRRSQLLTVLDKFREVLVTCNHEDPGITIWTNMNQT